MKTPYININGTYTFFHNGNPLTITPTDNRYNELLDALLSENEPALLSILCDNRKEFALSMVAKSIDVEHFEDLKFSITKENDEVIYATVTYKGQEIPELLKDKLISMYRAKDTNFNHLVKFIDNLLLNPDEYSRQQLYNFLEHKFLPITEDGTFIAYKAVSKNRYSITGNVNTHVISGETDAGGHILNSSGTTIRVRHEDVENNPDIGCSTGLHVGSYDYAADFAGQEGIVLAVEVNPRHVISVPTDCACRKCRVSEYKVLNPVENHFKAHTASIDDNNDVRINKCDYDWEDEDNDYDEDDEELTWDNVQPTRTAAAAFAQLSIYSCNIPVVKQLREKLADIAEDTVLITDCNNNSAIYSMHKSQCGYPYYKHVDGNICYNCAPIEAAITPICEAFRDMLQNADENAFSLLPDYKFWKLILEGINEENDCDQDNFCFEDLPYYLCLKQPTLLSILASLNIKVINMDAENDKWAYRFAL